MFSLRQLSMKPICLAVVASLCVFLPTLGMAGEAPVNPNCTDCAGTFMYYPDAAGSCGGVCVELVSSGGTTEVEIAPGVTVTAMCTTTACTNKVLDQDKIKGGVGSGGSAVTLTQESAELLAAAGKDDVATVGGKPFSPIGALMELATRDAINELSVYMPCGITLPAAAILTNLATALTSGDPTFIGTALNDALIAHKRLLANGSEQVPADLLDAVNTVIELRLSAEKKKS